MLIIALEVILVASDFASSPLHFRLRGVSVSPWRSFTAVFVGSCRDEMRDYERIWWHWIQSQTFDILNTCRQGQDFEQETGAQLHA